MLGLGVCLYNPKVNVNLRASQGAVKAKRSFNPRVS